MGTKYHGTDEEQRARDAFIRLRRAATTANTLPTLESAARWFRHDTSVTRWWLDFHNPQYGPRLAITQVAVQRWRHGRIHDERFYYNPRPVTEG